MGAEKRVRVVVRYTGHVQGVGFRMTAVAQSRGLDVHGTVRNEHDGSVKLDAEGSSDDVKTLMKRIDSAMSGKIDEAQVDSREPRGADGGLKIQY